MNRDWGFGNTENAFIEASIALPPDMAKIRALLDRGIDLNRVNKNGTETLAYRILSFYGQYYVKQTAADACLLDDEPRYDYDTTHLIELTELFLAYGAEVSPPCGDSLLEAMLYGANDENTLKAAEILLQHGADPNTCDELGENLCDQANINDSMADFVHNPEHPKPGLPDYLERFCRLLSKYGGRPNSTDWPY